MMQRESVTDRREVRGAACHDIVADTFSLMQTARRHPDVGVGRRAGARDGSDGPRAGR